MLSPHAQHTGRSRGKFAIIRAVLLLLLLLLAVPAVLIVRAFLSAKQDLANQDRGRSQDKQSEPSKDFTNTIGMKLVYIPPGSFTMGSSPEEIDRALKLTGRNWDEGCIKSEGPQHEVEITQGFFMGNTEVTFGQFRQFVDEAKYNVGDDRWKKPGWEQTDNHPVVFVDWNNAVAFCQWLSKKEGKKYRLPTEAEWEYCCRAGTKTRYTFGDNEEDLGSHAWFGANAANKAQPVKKLKLNPWKLHDMHGNVWQWCQDVYDPNYYKSRPPKDPTGPGADGERVFRGGSWADTPERCRSASRSHGVPGDRHGFLGFRVILEVHEPVTNSLGMKLAYIPSGRFTMGSSPKEIEHALALAGGDNWSIDRIRTEGPQHEVEITQPCYMGVTEVTVSQFRQFAEEAKYNVGDDRWKKPGFDQSDDYPVVWVRRKVRNTAYPRRRNGSIVVGPEKPLTTVLATTRPS
jgi:formylglycine-generating enzyme required for sulfatase activity